MIRTLFLTTALVGVVGHAASAVAQGVYINGVYTPAGGSITLPANGNVTLGTQPTLGSVYDAGAGAVTNAASDQYQVSPQGIVTTTAPVTGHGTTVTATPGFSQSYTVPADQNEIYNIVVPSAAPAAVTYAEPTYNTVAAPASSGWKARQIYVGARAGAVLARDTNFTVGPQGANPAVDIRNTYDDPGYTGSLVAGYGGKTAGGWGYRVELEGGYQTVEVESHRLRGVGTFRGSDANGDTNVLYGFINAYGDIPVAKRLAVTLGGGVGVGRVEFDDHGVSRAGTALDDTATAFGYHLDAGVSYQVTDAIAVEALYRYQSFIDANLRTENGNSEDIDVDSHNLLLGARVGF